MDRRKFLQAGTAAVVASGAPTWAAGRASPASAEQRPRPSPSQLAWQREELALFVHFTVNTYTDREWGEGDEDPRLFNPSRFDARQWARTAKQAGFASMILTAKHHDGFCLWPSATTAHGVRSSPWREGRGDVVREFVDACREYGLGAGLYLSPWDRNAPSYGTGRAYDDFYIAQLIELLSHYGPLVEVWFDGANGEGPSGRKQIYDWPRIHATVRRLQPGAVIFSDAGPDARWVGNEKGLAATTCWSSVDPARVPRAGANDPWTIEALQQGDPDGSVWRPAETDVSIRPGWFWHAAENDKVRSPDNLLDLYFSSVGRNSKLLLNVPANRDGLFEDADVRALQGFAARRQALFARDLLGGAGVEASGHAEGRRAQHVLDSDPQRHWSAPADARAGWLEFELPAPVEFDVIRLGEAIEHGQHIAGYRLQAGQDGRWTTIAWGTTIGHCRLMRIAPLRTQRLRLLIDFAYDTPRLQRVALYRTQERG